MNQLSALNFKEKYAKCVLQLEHLNEDLNGYLNDVQKYCQEVRIVVFCFLSIFNIRVKAESQCSDNEKQSWRKENAFVQLLHAEYAHAHSTNRMHSLCVRIVIIFIIAAVRLVLYYYPSNMPVIFSQKSGKYKVYSAIHTSVCMGVKKQEQNYGTFYTKEFCS